MCLPYFWDTTESWRTETEFKPRPFLNWPLIHTEKGDILTGENTRIIKETERGKRRMKGAGERGPKCNNVKTADI